MNFIATILFISNFSFAQTASTDLALATTPKTDSTLGVSKHKRDEKPNDGFAAKHSDRVISGIRTHLAQTLDYTDLMVTNGVEGEVVVEVRVSKSGEITPVIVKGLSAKLDDAVLSAINQMPCFDFSENGYQGARRFKIPVKFTLK